jgi:hypothetical protein
MPTMTEADWGGLKRDTWYFLGAQVASLGVLYLLPESISSWSDEQKEEAGFSKWKKNAGHPVVDNDDFYINYILHPYWGAAYYVRARERGFGRLNAFWYSAFLSTFYEFVPESLFEEPSIQDVVVTPLFGAWLGDYFMVLRREIEQRSAERGFRTGGENWIWILTDPLQVINLGMERLLGRDARLGFSPVLGPRLDDPLLTGSVLPATPRVGYPEVDRYHSGVQATRSLRSSAASRLAAFARHQQAPGYRQANSRVFGFRFEIRF